MNDVTLLATASNKVHRLTLENDRLRAVLEDVASWCEDERAKLGAIDGYDYHSGEEYGLRRAQIELQRRVHSSSDEQKADDTNG